MGSGSQPLYNGTAFAKLHDALRNLLENAVNYSPARTRVGGSSAPSPRATAAASGSRETWSE